MWTCPGCGNRGLTFLPIRGCGLLSPVRSKIGVVMAVVVFAVSAVPPMLDVSGEIVVVVLIGGIVVIEGVPSEDPTGLGLPIGLGTGRH